MESENVNFSTLKPSGRTASAATQRNRSRSIARRWALLIGAPALVVGGLGMTFASIAAPASAATSATFSCTGATQTWTVPAGVDTIAVTAFGASGGSGGGMTDTPAPGGLGGETTASLAVIPGEVLQLNVGCVGGTSPSNTPGAAGFNGGGLGGLGVQAGGGGGGGSSDIRVGGATLADRVLVAGGGGGGGGDQAGASPLATGGTGGGASGGDGASSDLVSGGGTGGTPATFGSGGGCQVTDCVGADGALVQGGAGGGSASAGNDEAGGGGGGGLWGGGGGGGDTNDNSNSGGGGGGGGSGFGPAGATLQNGVASPDPAGNGEIEFSYTPATVATTTPTTAAVATTATGPTGAAPAPGGLAVTGVNLTPLLVAGSALVLSGASLVTVISARRRKTAP
jgi:Glycine rich protein